jgi:hypothetical protein
MKSHLSSAMAWVVKRWFALGRTNSTDDSTIEDERPSMKRQYRVNAYFANKFETRP